MMVPYKSTTSNTIYYSSCGSSTTTTNTYDNTNDDYVIYCVNQKKKDEEKTIIKLQNNIPYPKIVKMRNTDGRPIQYSTWKPVRMLCGRDNIGVRNFCKK